MNNEILNQENDLKNGSSPVKKPVEKKDISSVRNFFSDRGIEIPEDVIEERLMELMTVYKVPDNEARRCAINYFSKKYGLEKKPYQSREDKGELKIQEMTDILNGNAEMNAGNGEDSDSGNDSGDGPENSSENYSENCSEDDPGNTSAGRSSNPPTGEKDFCATLHVRVVRLWDKNHETIAQSGIIGDETGTVRFTVWKDAGLPLLEEGKCYVLRDVVASIWDGRPKADLNKMSFIGPIDEDIKVAEAFHFDDDHLRKIDELNLEGIWANLKIKMYRLWENTHDSISQIGLAGDETGVIRMTVWKSAGCPLMDEGKCYLIKNAVTNEMNGRISISLNRLSTIEEIDENISIKFEEITMTGIGVDVRAGSGLIKRCPECKKSLQKGICQIHGKVVGFNDLRIKGIIDDGLSTYDLVIGKEITEQIIGMSLEEAVALAAETLEPEIIEEKARSNFVGSYFKVIGARTERTILVTEIEEMLPETDIESLKSMIESDMNDPERKKFIGMSEFEYSVAYGNAEYRNEYNYDDDPEMIRERKTEEYSICEPRDEGCSENEEYSEVEDCSDVEDYSENEDCSFVTAAEIAEKENMGNDEKSSNEEMKKELSNEETNEEICIDEETNEEICIDEETNEEICIDGETNEEICTVERSSIDENAEVI